MSSLRNLLKKYEGGGSRGGEGSRKRVPWFSLKDDGDTANVRFLITDEVDMMNFVREVHRAKIGSYENNVVCTGADCEFCRRGEPKSVRMLVPLYNLEKREVQIWSRGLTDINQLLNNFDEYGPLNNRTYKIKRNGRSGNTNTTYSYFPKDREEMSNFDELREQVPNVVGRDFRYFLNLTREQQIEVIETGKVTFNRSEESGIDEDEDQPNDERVF